MSFWQELGHRLPTPHVRYTNLLWPAQFGPARSASGWSTFPSSSTARPRPRPSASTSSRARPGARIRQKRVDPVHRRGGSLRGDRQGLRDHARSLRADHARGARRARPEGDEDDRHRGVRRPVGDRPDLLRPLLLPGARPPAAPRPTGLLLDAMRESGKVGIGKVVLRTKQQLCALRPTGDVLTLSTMLFGDEVLAPDRLDELDAIGDAGGDRSRAEDGRAADRLALRRVRSDPSSRTSTASACSI